MTNEGRASAVHTSGLRKDGLRFGTWRSWREDGSLLVKATFQGGRRHGAWTRWHPNGALAVRLRYTAGLGEGPLRAWHPNGTLALEATLRGGVLDGPLPAWRQDGAPWGTGRFVSGALTHAGRTPSEPVFVLPFPAAHQPEQYAG